MATRKDTGITGTSGESDSAGGRNIPAMLAFQGLTVLGVLLERARVHLCL